MQAQHSDPAKASLSGPTAFRPSTDSRGPPSPATDSSPTCPNCNHVIEFVDVSEAVCPKCDLVLEDEPISTAPRPRYGNHTDDPRARTGSRVTLLYADRGLGVGIPRNVTTDGNGTPLSRTQRRVARKKPWAKHRTPAEVRLDYALGEIRRMGEALSVPTAECERAAQLYRKAHDDGHVTGRSVDGIATACLLVAIRQSSLSLPVSQRELTGVSRASDEQIRTARGVLELHMEVEIPPMDARDFIPRATSRLSTPWKVRQCAQALLDAREADDDREYRGLSPRTLAAAALHASYDIVGCQDRPTLSDLSSVLDVAASTISERKDVLFQYRGVWE